MAGRRRVAVVVALLAVALGGLVGLRPAARAVANTGGWKVQSSAVVTDQGVVISDPGYRTDSWLPISGPETLMAALLENGRYPQVFFSNNLASVPTGQFAVNWWYREQVVLHPAAGQRTYLTMNGVLSRANLWVNGTKVADQSQLQGAYSKFEYDISPYVRDGANAVALDVFPNDSKSSTGYLTLGMLDWNRPSPDNYTGLQFAPELTHSGPVAVRDVHVVQHNAADLSTSDLTVLAELRNDSDVVQPTELTGSIVGPGSSITFRSQVAVPPNTSVPVSLSPADFPQLHISRPAIWWPYQMGGQPMYHLAIAAHLGNSTGGRGSRDVSDRAAEDFGIRTVTSYLTPVVPGQTLAPAGYRQFVINGRPFVVRGGGWSQDMFLRYSHDNVRDQLRYIKNMGLNAIRFEGNLPPEDMFAQMDREGILALPGFQCCNKWEQPSSSWSDQTKANAANQAANVARWLRDHPSVLAFYEGSDNEPDPAKESIYLKAFTAADWQPPLISSAEYKASAALGDSGSKEGPYNYVPPAYWWHAGPEMSNPDDAFTNAGGAFGLDTETSAGNTIPTQDSLNRFLSGPDQDQIWDPSSTGGPATGPEIFHDSKYTPYTAIGKLGQYNTALWHRYGTWSDLPSYEREAQAGGYEIARAQFEAYIGRSKDPANPSTGVIYWQMNKAWPSLQWQLYGYDFDQAGVFFGVKKADEPVHIMYSYEDGTVKVANLTNDSQVGLHARAEFIDLDGTVQGMTEAAVPRLGSQDVLTALTPARPAGISTTHFLRLTLTRAGRTVSRNVYWLSSKPDSIDWAKTIDQGDGAEFTPDGYADLTGLRNLPTATVSLHATTRHAGGQDITDVTITNTGNRTTPLFFGRADVRRAGADGSPDSGDNQVSPILWTDNDITLWPGESQTITARYSHDQLRGARPVVTVAGWNLGTQVVPVQSR
jgi:exo-1,4-beta-D-glucosaminidase